MGEKSRIVRVIASEAKQSRVPCSEHWIASCLAMTGYLAGRHCERSEAIHGRGTDPPQNTGLNPATRLLYP